MNCPHCDLDLPKGTSECAYCGFSAAAIESVLGKEWVHLERITDNANRLGLRAVRALEAVLDDFERTFPQCFLALYIGSLPATLTVRSLGFWLINHGAFHTHRLANRNDFGMVLVIDPLSETVGLTLGYALEECLNQRQLERLLHRLGPSLRAGNFQGVVEMAVKELTAELRRHAAARLRHERAPRALPSLLGLGLQTLRQNHRASTDVPRAPVS